MAWVKRLLLLAAVGSVSIVIAGCYGQPSRYQPAVPFPPPPDADNGEPIAGLETAPASPSK
ncbi:MAG: hypothetical protein HQ567_32915 [Candidatus Nealsonbacteria bacterium]|nr:hypothetical protein [Candidatus Nealsonbacteria bacterium]